MEKEFHTQDTNQNNTLDAYTDNSSIKQVVEIIKQITKTEAIFLLGVTISTKKTNCIFQSPQVSEKIVKLIWDCFLLILTSDDHLNEQYQWQERIEAKCKLIIPVSTIVIPTFQFTYWLSEYHPFAMKVNENGTLIYKSEKIALPECPEGFMVNNSKSLGYEFGKAKEFLAGSELFELRRQYSMATFMLHQTVEQTLHTIIRGSTGYYANTHNIGRLLSYAKFIVPEIANIIPLSSEEDKRLLQLLQKAYIDGRYQSDYKIPYKDLAALKDMAIRLIRMVDVY